MSDYDLSQLLAGITPDNLHAEVNFGPAVGLETEVLRGALYEQTT